MREGLVMLEGIYKTINKTSDLFESSRQGLEAVRRDDPVLYKLLELETRRQSNVLPMVAASSEADPSVLACEGLALTNVTTEGYPNARFHGGCEIVDQVEELAIERACAVFDAQYANVQPHSGSSANLAVIFSLLRPGDTLLGMDLDAGGHLTHGSKASVIGQYFNAVGYGVNAHGVIDYDEVRDIARKCQPRLIICGASAYSRIIDFAAFRAIADEVGALLLADISHIAGLVVGGVHPSPIDHAHVTTTSTYKQLFGPRGGVILCGRDSSQAAWSGKGTFADTFQRAVFPFSQGTPNLSAIAAKARAFANVQRPEFKLLARRIVDNAQALASYLLERSYDVLTGGTDNHTILINLSDKAMTGLVAERALNQCGIIVNKNRLPGDTKSARVTSGIRLGTNLLAHRGLAPSDMRECAELIDETLMSIRVMSDQDYELEESVIHSVRARVERICCRFRDTELNPLGTSLPVEINNPTAIGNSDRAGEL